MLWEAAFAGWMVVVVYVPFVLLVTRRTSPEVLAIARVIDHEYQEAT